MITVISYPRTNKDWATKTFFIRAKFQFVENEFALFRFNIRWVSLVYGPTLCFSWFFIIDLQRRKQAVLDVRKVSPNKLLSLDLWRRDCPSARVPKHSLLRKCATTTSNLTNWWEQQAMLIKQAGFRTNSYPLRAQKWKTATSSL